MGSPAAGRRRKQAEAEAAAQRKKDAARRAEDKRYGIKESDYLEKGRRRGKGGRRPDVIHHDVRDQYIENAQIRKTTEEQRMTRESRDKEEKLAKRKVRDTEGRPMGRISLLTALGASESRYRGL